MKTTAEIIEILPDFKIHLGEKVRTFRLLAR